MFLNFILYKTKRTHQTEEKRYPRLPIVRELTNWKQSALAEMLKLEKAMDEIESIYKRKVEKREKEKDEKATEAKDRNLREDIKKSEQSDIE